MGRGKKLILTVLILLMASLAQEVYAGTAQEPEAEETILDETDTKKPETGEEEEEKPALPALLGYEFLSPEADGENGYYTRFPGGSLVQRDVCMITSWKLQKPDGTEETGELAAENLQKTWEPEAMDGTWKLELTVRMREGLEETYQGTYTEEELAPWNREFSWQVDGTPPKLEILTPERTEGWFGEPVLVTARAEDKGSGMEAFDGGAGKKTWSSGNGTELSFVVSEESSGNRAVAVWAEARDLAGNRTRKEFSLLTDWTPPRIWADGPEAFSVLAEAAGFSLHLEEANTLGEVETSLWKRTPEGQEENVPLPDWQAGETGPVLAFSLETDGIYRIQVRAKDRAGNQAFWERQVTVDCTAPVLSYPQNLAGQYLREFQWDYREDTVAEDMTACALLVYLDGRIYPSGQRVQKEGAHLLEVRARDMAGNQTEQSVAFQIDRTPPVIQVQNAQTGEILRDGDRLTGRPRITVRTGDGKDLLYLVQINGEEKLLSRGQTVWTGEFSEAGVYEILAEAADRAGNRRTCHLGFQLGEAGEEEDGEEQDSRTENDGQASQKGTGRSVKETESPALAESRIRKQVFWTARRTLTLLAGLICAGGAAAAVCFGWKRNRQKEDG